MQAESIRAFGTRAFDDGAGVDFAVERELRSIANESPVADVVILKLAAIFVHQAVAGEGDADAFTTLALVAQGASVAVVTGIVIVVVEATSNLAAGVVSTGIVVIAVDEFTDANTVLAMVSFGARIAVHALTALHWCILATCFPEAFVDCAGVAIIAQFLVDLPVAVVVQTVAGFLFSRACIAVGQAVRKAYSLPAACPDFVGNGTGSGQPQRH